MSETLVQAERWLTLETPLGADALLATEVDGVEGISRLFEFHVSALSGEDTIVPADLLGKSVDMSLARPGGERRIVNGIVVSLSGGAVTRSGYRLFRLTIAPQLWTLQRSSDYRVFQKKTAVEIVKDILQARQVPFEERLQASYEQREYCVQFGETDLAFVERLLAEEGIFYFFRHESGRHTLVLADNANAYDDCAQADVDYRQDAEDVTDAVHALDFGAHLTDAKWSLRDYDFETPATPVEGSEKTSLRPATAKDWEQFVYPGGSLKSTPLTRLAKVDVDASDAGFETTTGRGACASFAPGHRFTLRAHPVDALNGVHHVLTEVRHRGVDRAHFTIRAGMEGKPFYRNEFTCMPAKRIARAIIPPPKPLARGPQTALVVGASGDEVHTDAYGRIRVQFHWDRKGQKSEASSCFVHVAQGLAGPGWGTVFIPRVGMEVVVQFLDGDPDRPLVTGAVYNGANAPPWVQSGSTTKTGIMTRSTTDGSSSNASELSFEDKRGEEKVLFHAEKDFVREVENDDTLEVGNDQKRTIKNHRTTTITDGNDTYTLKSGNRAETIENGDETLGIKKGKRTVTLGAGEDVLTLDQGNRSVSLKAGDDKLELARGNHTTKASAGSITLEAATKITLKCGTTTVELTPSGLTIKSTTVDIKADATATLKGAMVETSGSAMLTLKGGVVKIN